MASVFDVADYFLYKSKLPDSFDVTPLKLQKLAYYAQAWSLVFLGEPLFEEHFEAWAHGPVNPDLFHKYRDYGFYVIDEEVVVNEDSFSEEQTSVLDEVWDVYGKYDGKFLERLTHQELPWLEARGDLPPGARCNTPIDWDTMREYYGNLLEQNGEET